MDITEAKNNIKIYTSHADECFENLIKSLEKQAKRKVPQSLNDTLFEFCFNDFGDEEAVYNEVDLFVRNLPLKKKNV